MAFTALAGVHDVVVVGDAGRRTFINLNLII